MLLLTSVWSVLVLGLILGDIDVSSSYLFTKTGSDMIIDMTNYPAHDMLRESLLEVPTKP